MPRIYSINLGGGSSAQVIEVDTAGDLPNPPDSGVILAYVEDTDTLYAWNTDANAWLIVGGSSAFVGRADQVSIANGAQSVAVTFSSAMPDTDYAVSLSIGNTVDADPIFLSAIRVNKLTTGFTVDLNAPTDSANYVMDYMVTRDV